MWRPGQGTRGGGLGHTSGSNHIQEAHRAPDPHRNDKMELGKEVNREASCRGRALGMLKLLCHLPSSLGPDSYLPIGPSVNHFYSRSESFSYRLTWTFLSPASYPSPDAPPSHALSLPRLPSQVGMFTKFSLSSKPSQGCSHSHLCLVQLSPSSAPAEEIQENALPPLLPAAFSSLA